jgi:hypothetical protein
VSFRGAVRALLEAHLRAGFNGALRNAGLALTTVALVASVLVWLLVGVPMCLALGAMGASVALDARALWPVAGSVFLFAPLFGSVVSVMTGDANELDLEKLAPYPVPPRALFVAELLASFAHPVMALAAGMQVAFAVGVLVRARPAGLAALVAMVTGLVVQAGLRALLAAGATRVMRRAQGALVLVLSAAPVAVLALARRYGDAALDAAVARFARGTALLPGGVQVSVPARWGELGAAQALAFLLGPLIAAALLLVLAERAARTANATAPQVQRGAARLWTFRFPVLGLARLQLASLWGTELGRFTLFLPLFWLLFLPVAGDAPELQGRPEVVSMFIWALLPTMLASCTLNQFGFDRGAVKALFLLPISDAQVLYGKAIAFGAVLLAQAVLVAAVVSVLVPQSPLFLVAGPAMTMTVGGLHLLIGQWTSLAWPRPIARRGLKQPPASLVAGLIVLATLVGTVLPLAGLWWFLGGNSPAGLTATLLLLAAGVAGLFFVFTPLAAKALALRRERLVESLS